MGTSSGPITAISLVVEVSPPVRQPSANRWRTTFNANDTPMSARACHLHVVRHTATVPEGWWYVGQRLRMLANLGQRTLSVKWTPIVVVRCQIMYVGQPALCLRRWPIYQIALRI